MMICSGKYSGSCKASEIVKLGHVGLPEGSMSARHDYILGVFIQLTLLTLLTGSSSELEQTEVSLSNAMMSTNAENASNPQAMQN